MDVKNKKWSEEEFFRVRKEVLAQWRTGKEIEDINEGIEYVKKMPKEKIVAHRCEMLEKEDKIEVSMMLGVATVEQMKEHMLFLEDLKPQWSWHPDTWTRSRQFARVEEAIERSKREGRSVINGYPIINHGVKKTRELVESVSASISFNVSDRDTRLQAEMCCASGITSICTHSLNDIAQHHRDCPLDEKIWYAQYNAWLAGYYTAHGAPIACDIPGNFTGWDMPGFRLADSILEILLTAEQGAKVITSSLDLGLNLIQDVANYRVRDRLVREYLDRFGYKDVKFYGRSDGWLGDHPIDLGRANAMVAWQIIIPVLAGVRRIFLKSVDEAVSLTTKEGNRMAYMNARQLLLMMGNQRMPESETLKTEMEMIEKEARAIVEKVLEVGDGDVVIGMVKAVEHGILDTQFSPWRHFKGKVLLVRDAEGAIRYLNHANLPLPKEVVDYHKEKIAQREKKEGRKADLEWVMENVTLISQPF